jgi:hypothetical protein
MFTRIIMLMLIAVLALPVTTLTPPAATSHWSGSQSAVAAKGKKHNKKTKPKSRTVTRTVRGPVTQTFTGTGPIAIPKEGSSSDKGSANPYPATIEVSGMPNGVITDVDLLLFDVTHVQPEDIDVLLAKDDGRRALVMSDVGRNNAITNVDLTLDDEAAASMPAGIFDPPLDSESYRPTNFTQPVDVDDFAAPAPAPDGSVALSTFDGANPNGTWQLFVTDDETGLVGEIRTWALRITAEVETGTVEEQVPAGKDANNRGKRKKNGIRSRR